MGEQANGAGAAWEWPRQAGRLGLPLRSSGFCLVKCGTTASLHSVLCYSSWHLLVLVSLNSFLFCFAFWLRDWLKVFLEQEVEGRKWRVRKWDIFLCDFGIPWSQNPMRWDNYICGLLWLGRVQDFNNSQGWKWPLEWVRNLMTIAPAFAGTLPGMGSSLP